MNGALDHSDQPDPDAIKMFVGQIPRSWSEKELKELFEPYGAVYQINVLRDRSQNPPQSKGTECMWHGGRGHSGVRVGLVAGAGIPGLTRAPRAFPPPERGWQRGKEGSLVAAGAGSLGVLAVPQSSSQNSRLLGQVGLKKEGRNAAQLFMVPFAPVRSLSKQCGLWVGLLIL